MSDAMDLLARHHGEADAFVNVMKKSASNRFDEAFWQLWQQWIQPTLSDNATVCDFGCGPATFLKQFHIRQPQAKLIGVECMPYMIAEIDTSLCEVVEHDLNQPNFPVADNSLDVFISTYVLHEMVQPMYALQAMYSSLKSGQRGLIMDWVRAPLATYLQTQETDILSSDVTQDDLVDTFNHFVEHNRYSMEDMTWLLEQVGFTVLEQQLKDNPNFAHWIVQKP